MYGNNCHGSRQVVDMMRWGTTGAEWSQPTLGFWEGLAVGYTKSTIRIDMLVYVCICNAYAMLVCSFVYKRHSTRTCQATKKIILATCRLFHLRPCGRQTDRLSIRTISRLFSKQRQVYSQQVSTCTLGCKPLLKETVFWNPRTENIIRINMLFFVFISVIYIYIHSL